MHTVTVRAIESFEEAMPKLAELTGGEATASHAIYVLRMQIIRRFDTLVLHCDDPDRNVVFEFSRDLNDTNSSLSCRIVDDCAAEDRFDPIYAVLSLPHSNVLSVQVPSEFYNYVQLNPLDSNHVLASVNNALRASRVITSDKTH